MLVNILIALLKSVIANREMLKPTSEYVHSQYNVITVLVMSHSAEEQTPSVVGPLVILVYKYC